MYYVVCSTVRQGCQSTTKVPGRVPLEKQVLLKLQLMLKSKPFDYADFMSESYKRK